MNLLITALVSTTIGFILGIFSEKHNQQQIKEAELIIKLLNRKKS